MTETSGEDQVPVSSRQCAWCKFEFKVIPTDTLGGPPDMKESFFVAYCPRCAFYLPMIDLDERRQGLDPETLRKAEEYRRKTILDNLARRRLVRKLPEGVLPTDLQLAAERLGWPCCTHCNWAFPPPADAAAHNFFRGIEHAKCPRSHDWCALPTAPSAGSPIRGWKAVASKLGLAENLSQGLENAARTEGFPMPVWRDAAGTPCTNEEKLDAWWLIWSLQAGGVGKDRQQVEGTAASTSASARPAGDDTGAVHSAPQVEEPGKAEEEAPHRSDDVDTEAVPDTERGLHVVPWSFIDNEEARRTRTIEESNRIEREKLDIARREEERRQTERAMRAAVAAGKYFCEFCNHAFPSSMFEPGVWKSGTRYVRHVGTPRLGVGIGPAPDGRGFLVSSVQKGSPAEDVGLRGGDRILSVAGQALDGADANAAFDRAVWGAPAGPVDIRMRRRRGEQEVEEVLLAVLPPVVPGQRGCHQATELPDASAADPKPAPPPGVAPRNLSGAKEEEQQVAPAEVAPAADAQQNTIKREGEIWKITYGGKSIQLVARAGLGHIFELLMHPYRKHDAGQLARKGQAPERKFALPNEEGEDTGPASCSRRRKSNLEDERIAELERERDKRKAELAAIADGDVHADDRRDTLKRELQLFEDTLRSATGRDLGCNATQAWRTVSRAVYRAFKHIKKEHPKLHAHLKRSIRMDCLSYEPEPRVDWHS